ncbi:unnamed protein product [Pleuronectes platessa]|uniref:Uncharacterized protein n=1 Tax=Pleuronectes platessa TaxID=8262 RepID=A0A9N7ZAI6_PLEPL|nr:unnamed protein product [Pleuronectes platessa]
MGLSDRGVEGNREEEEDAAPSLLSAHNPATAERGGQAGDAIARPDRLITVWLMPCTQPMEDAEEEYMDVCQLLILGCPDTLQIFPHGGRDEIKGRPCTHTSLPLPQRCNTTSSLLPSLNASLLSSPGY